MKRHVNEGEAAVIREEVMDITYEIAGEKIADDLLALADAEGDGTTSGKGASMALKVPLSIRNPCESKLASKDYPTIWPRSLMPVADLMEANGTSMDAKLPPLCRNPRVPP